MKSLWISVRAMIVLTILCGLIYPLAVSGIATAFFREKAGGGLVERGGKVVGSALLAQEFKGDRYFHPRPSSVSYNPIPSGGSNLGPTSKALLDRVEEARKKGVEGDELFTSGSGLDPHISPATALAQVKRVAASRGRDPEQIRSLVMQHTEGRQFGFLGEPRVNVLLLNLALDETGGRDGRP